MRARLGISTYAYTWRMSELVERPLTLDELVVDAQRLGLGVLQVCDHPPLEVAPPDELAHLRAHADAHGIALEVGTRGIGADHLLRMLDVAVALGSPVVRSMLTAGDDRPSVDEAVERLLAVADAYADAGVALGLETYEQVPTATLLDVVERVGRPETVGICLDPANPVAGLEHPRDVVERCAAATVNVHVKDFAFTRAPGWVGFTYSGARMGEGALDYAHLLETVRPVERGLSQIVEHWVTWPGTIDEAVAIEAEWTEHAARVLLAAHPAD
ncbi:sugar phosphate isomerase/epimerase family protein [Agrococcus jejuensis]|uniref:Sugar phosphate isomerase/epimerase n=1 Tax=Agrococcus jejuensis TaxID=399736 RepID=A0A1G8AC10_9MICO|nr:sugar phosphate isomerase/epimerase [Agrococcus jejuensis]SDH18417.1 Sugar phosphate isomerase/epimerase [Agrococcus jejuensis]